MTKGHTLNDSLLETTLLALLKREPAHGYYLAIQAKSLGVPIGDVSRVYRTLRPLAAKGIVRVDWDTSDKGKGPARKVYTLTRKGDRHLRSKLSELHAWISLAQDVRGLCAPEMAVR